MKMHSVAQLVFIPVDFAVAWVAGVAVRARAEQAEVAQTRATTEQKRETWSRASRARTNYAPPASASSKQASKHASNSNVTSTTAPSSSSSRSPLDLQLLQTRITDTPTLELLDTTRAKLTDALASLRALARDIDPAPLTDRGLAPALEALSATRTAASRAQSRSPRAASGNPRVSHVLSRQRSAH